MSDDIHRMNVDEYVHVVDALDWDRTELIDGVVYDLAAVVHRQAETLGRVLRRLDAHVGDERTYARASVRFDDRTLFDPDVIVVKPEQAFDPDDFIPAAAVLLAVDVSLTDRRRDRPKLMAYAKAGVPEVWLIDPRPEVGELTRYRQPGGASYTTVDRFDVGEDAADLEVAVLMERERR